MIRLRRFARIQAPGPLPSGLSPAETESVVRDSIKRDRDEPPALVSEVRTAVEEAGFRFEDWLSTSVVSGHFECRRGGVVLDVYVTWNVAHQQWFLLIAPARVRSWLHRPDAEKAVLALCEAIESKLKVSAGDGPVEWFTEEEWDEVEQLRPEDRVEWIAEPYVVEAPTGEQPTTVRPGDTGEVVGVDSASVVRRLVERLGGPEPNTITVAFSGGATVVCRRSDVRRL